MILVSLVCFILIYNHYTLYAPYTPYTPYPILFSLHMLYGEVVNLREILPIGSGDLST